MKITVPEKAGRKPALTIPPAGWVTAAVERVREEQEPEEIVLRWKFRAEGKLWRLEQFFTAKGLVSLLAKFPQINGEISVDELVGLEARIEVVTFGGRSSASIREVTPLPAEE